MNFLGCPVCHEIDEHHPECPETEDIRVLEALQVGDMTAAIADATERIGLRVETKGGAKS